MSASLGVWLVRTVRRWSLPLGCYYAITVALPLANGAARRGAVFVSHALAVLVWPLLLILLACVVGTCADVCRRAWIGLRSPSTTTILSRRLITTSRGTGLR